jgi:predicted glutamine amidotransferase
MIAHIRKATETEGVNMTRCHKTLSKIASG